MIDKAWRPTAKTWEKINEMAPTVMSMSFPEPPLYRPELGDTMEARINERHGWSSERGLPPLKDTTERMY